MADKIVEPKKRGNLRKARQAALKKAPDNAEFKKLLSGIYSRINRMKVPKIELNPVVKEAADPHVIVDDSKPAQTETPQPVVQVEAPKDPITSS